MTPIVEPEFTEDAPKEQLTYGSRAIYKTALTLWNDCPLELRQSPSKTLFKKKWLKTYLFSQA